MRQGYMPRDGIRFRPDPVHVAQFLPEVSQARPLSAYMLYD